MRKALHLRLTAAFLGLLIASVLGGCIVITGQSSQQLNAIGAVRLTTAACVSGQAGCPDKGNSGRQGSAGFQVLLGYRVPQAASVPQQINTIAGHPLSFARDHSYAAELERLAPAEEGQKWLGYRSGHVASLSAPSFTVSPTFSLKQASNGAPFNGPFAYRVVTGARRTPDGDPNRAVDCGSNLAGHEPTNTSCVDSPPLSELSTDLLQPTQDLGILSTGAPDRASEGSVLKMPFRLLYAGKRAEAPAFSLDAWTDVPDGTAQVTPGTIKPAGASKAKVLLRVPHDTPSGSYDVTLVATTPGGQVRSRIHHLQVGPTKRRCGSVRPTIVGTDGRDLLTGTRRRDVIAGFGGDDRIRGRGGNDLICAGGGDDTVKGGDGNDTLAGRQGRDLLVGGRGRDLMIGGRGKDRFRH